MREKVKMYCAVDAGKRQDVSSAASKQLSGRETVKQTNKQKKKKKCRASKNGGYRGGG